MRLLLKSDRPGYSCERTPWVLVTGAEPLNHLPASALRRLPFDGMKPTFRHRRPEIKMHKLTPESKKKEENAKQPCGPQSGRQAPFSALNLRLLREAAGQPLFFPRAENKEIHNKAMQPIENQPPALLALHRQRRVSESDKTFRQVFCGHPTSAGHESPKRTAPLNLRESLTPNVRLRLKQGQIPPVDSPGWLNGGLCRFPATGREHRDFRLSPGACQAVRPSSFNFQPSTSLTNVCQPWN